MSMKSLVATLALLCALTLAAPPALAVPGATTDAAPAPTAEAEASVTADPFPTLETWLTPGTEGIGYCYHDCSPCLDSSQCGGFPCTSIPAC